MARPVGVDISKYQAPADLTKPHGINFQLMVDVAAFIMARAGYAGSAGGAWVDPRVHEYMKDLAPLLRQRRIPFTFYWYFRDDVSIMDQVNQFSSVINEYSDVVNLPLVVDAEAFTKANLTSTQKIVDFQTEVERNTSKKCDILYGRAGQLNAETTPGLEVVLPHLWIARYDSRLDEQVDEPWEEGGPQEYVEPRDYDEWLFWQYTESGNEKLYGVTAGAIGIDLNVFNGTMEELRTFAGLDEPGEPIDILFEMQTQVREAHSNSHTALSFSPPENSVKPQFASLSFGKGTVAKISMFYVINDVPFKFTESNLRYRDWAYVDLPNAWLGKNDFLWIEIFPVEGQTFQLEAKVAWS